MRRKLAAGNWKMHGLAHALTEIDALASAHPAPDVDILVCPPATLIDRMRARAKDAAIKVGGQTCHPAETGAHTGEISAAMLADAGATHVILGHSERRADNGETSADVHARCEAALAAGLIAIVCVGETEDQRDAGTTLDIILDQLSGSIPDTAKGDALVVAYEPVWAIGTGRVPTTEQIGEVHRFIRQQLQIRFGEDVGGAIVLLYGGSVKSANAADIFAVADVDGALVGGASLKAADFSGIIAALEAAD